MLADLESARVERTISTTDTNKFCEAMKSLGFVNRFGYGVQRAQALLKQNGNPPAAFDFDPHSVLVKIYRRPG